MCDEEVGRDEKPFNHYPKVKKKVRKNQAGELEKVIVSNNFARFVAVAIKIEIE